MLVVVVVVVDDVGFVMGPGPAPTAGRHTTSTNHAPWAIPMICTISGIPAKYFNDIATPIISRYETASISEIDRKQNNMFTHRARQAGYEP